MKYFIIAGEASGDLHASNLMRALKEKDGDAEFHFLGGDLMLAQGGQLIRHYKDMAFMGIVPVLLHLKTVLKNMKLCKQAILDYKPDALILVDYPSFNLGMAEFVKKELPGTPVYYYISPKLWAWKEYRLKSIKKHVDRVFSILPFEVEWFKARGYDVDYVGNPCVDAVAMRNHKNETRDDFMLRTGLGEKPILALLAGSRLQEIKSSLPIMLEAAAAYPDHQLVIAGAPAIDKSVYDELMNKYSAKLLVGETYELLQQSDLAVVTSGTATLETALLRVPQVVVYKMSGGWLFHRIVVQFIRVPFISLVNLIANRWVVKELVVEEFTVKRLREEIDHLLNAEYRAEVMKGYDEIIKKLGSDSVSEKTASAIYTLLKQRK